MRYYFEVKAREVIDKFFNYYSKRSAGDIDSVTSLFDGDSVDVIGTTAVNMGCGEWCKSIDQVASLITDDFVNWGVIQYSSDHLSIFVGDVFATASTEGRLYLDFAPNNIDCKVPHQLSCIPRCTDEFNQVYYPLRISFALVRRGNEWKIRQLHFSHPVAAL